MAFVKKTWKDRIVQYANRRLLTKSGGEVEQVTVTRDEGTISEAGDQFNASNMNDLEQRVKDGFDGLNASDIEYSSGVTVKQAIDSKQPLILQTTISGTTDGTGDISLTGLPISQYRVLSCIKIRNTANPDVAYCVLGGYSTGTSLPYAHLINSSNANYSNKAVELTVNYIAL